MNREYCKFNALADVYIPPATEPEHFSNLPDVLIPSDYHEVEGDLIEKDIADLIRETQTPPSTPPELEPGRAGYRLFREVKHYVAPCYQDENFQRLFMVQLIIGNMITYIPTVITLIILMSMEELDYVVMSNPRFLLSAFVLAIIATTVYIYFVGLFRNPPGLYIAIGVRCILNTIFFSCGMLLVHVCFLQIIDHPSTFEGQHNDSLTSEEEEVKHDHGEVDHAPPYMAVLTISLMGFVYCVVSLLVIKYKYSVNDYRIPFVIYTSCFSISAFLTTIVLNHGFGTEPLGYDLFQVIVGCYTASMLLMRTPHFMGRLIEGKVCPLKEGEVTYPLLHYGL